MGDTQNTLDAEAEAVGIRERARLLVECRVAFNGLTDTGKFAKTGFYFRKKKKQVKLYASERRAIKYRIINKLFHAFSKILSVYRIFPAGKVRVPKKQKHAQEIVRTEGKKERILKDRKTGLMAKYVSVGRTHKKYVLHEGWWVTPKWLRENTKT